MRPPDRTGTIVTAALFAPLVLLLLVAVMTWRAERRVAAVADRVVHDYAAIAVWQYARRASEALHDEVMRTFGPGPSSHVRSGPADPPEAASTLLAMRDSRRSAFLDSARFAFVYDAAANSLDATPGTIPASLRERLATLVGTTSAGSEPHHVLFADGLAIAVWVMPRSGGVLPIVKGVAAPARALDSIFARTLREEGLLPAIGGVGPRTLALRLDTPDGAPVFANAARIGGTAATDSTGLQGGALHATLDIPPALARQLLAGSLPPSQLPPLALIILAAAVLASLGLVQHARSRALEEARARFVANVSHELRTPLAQISMFAETIHLGRERSDAERRHFAGIVLSEARRLASLVENVLRVSRGERRNAIAPETADAAQRIDAALAAFAPITAAAHVEVESVVEDGLLLHADSGAFQQVMLNLLDNAVKHGGGGRIVVQACTIREGVRITVDDAGPGVPPEWRARVFDPFVQVAGRNVAGAGIGLAIVRDLVEAHGGHAAVESSPLGGARFALTFPQGAPALVEA